MNPISYFRVVWKTNKSFTIFSMISLAAMQVLILNLVTSFDTQAIIDSIFEQLPQNMQIFLKDSFFSSLTFDGAAAFGYNHPMVIALMVLNAINIPVRHISRELETGTLELLLSHPVKRQSFILTLWISGVVILLMISAAAFLGSISGIYWFHQLSASTLMRILEISLNMWLFSILVLSYTLMIATATKGGGLSGNLSAMITFVFYLLFLLAQLWDKIEFLGPFNIFYYYEPQQVMMGQGHFGMDVWILSVLSLLCLGLGIFFFNRRDIP